MDWEILLRLSLAVLWGGLVGIEREYRSKSAGFRTLIMISLGACAFTIMSQYIGAGGNPDRIASNIVTGIGFLGAGVIFRGQGRINGITTAATIWAVAAVGMSIGAGYYFLAGCASVLILMVLAILPLLEQYIDLYNRTIEYTIECDYTEDVQQRYEAIFKKHDLKSRLTHFLRQGQSVVMTWEAQGHLTSHTGYKDVMSKLTSITRFEY